MPRNLGTVSDGLDTPTKAYVDGKAPFKTSVSLSTTWSGSDPYTQTVTISGYTVTANSLISLQADDTTFNQLKADGTELLRVDNNNGILTATALGAAPTAALTVQCTVTEVTV